jgi:thymidylate synthase (FAD)
MLKTLAQEGHHTPYEKSLIHFLATTDIATHIQLLKHRIGVSINGESARYKELRDDKYYLPQDWDEEELELYIAHMEEALARYHSCLERLVAKGMPRKRAKESARFYLPYGNQITVDVSFNFRSFAHFVGLRYTTHAQVEIRDLTGKMLEIVKGVGAFPRTLEAFGFVDEHGNITAPL